MGPASQVSNELTSRTYCALSYLIRHLFNQHTFRADSTATESVATSDYLVVFLRMMASAQLKSHAEEIQPFLVDGRTVQEMCAEDIDPMGKEADHLAAEATAKALGIAIAVVYVDRVSANFVMCLQAHRHGR